MNIHIQSSECLIHSRREEMIVEKSRRDEIFVDIQMNEYTIFYNHAIPIFAGLRNACRINLL